MPVPVSIVLLTERSATDSSFARAGRDNRPISMRTIERTGQFRKDYKRESKGQYRKTLDADLVAVITALANDEPLAARYRDHPSRANGKITGTAMSGPIWC